MSMEDQLTLLAKRIRKARVDSHISQFELGTSVGVSDKSVSSYEKGRSIPSLETLHKIAEVTNRPLTYFTNEDGVAIEVASRLARIEKDLQDLKKLLNSKK